MADSFINHNHSGTVGIQAGQIFGGAHAGGVQGAQITALEEQLIEAMTGAVREALEGGLFPEADAARATAELERAEQRLADSEGSPTARRVRVGAEVIGAIGAVVAAIPGLS